jgi:hypothetical protein
MTISGFNPINALPSFASSGVPNGSLPNASQLSGNSLYGASAGAVEKPGIGTRLMSAMRSAISELRGTSPSSIGLPMQTLALQAPVSPAPVKVTKPASGSGAKAKFPNAKTWIDKGGNVRQLGTGKVLKAAAGAAAPSSAQTSGAQNPGAGTQLPSNATQLQGATVYSYDQNGNPVAPTMQQLGMTPTMLQGLQGMAGAVDPDGPQMNATNQSNIGTGMGLGLGSSVPVLGQPINTAQPSPTSPGDAGAATGSTGGTQSVTNANSSDNLSRNQGLGYGSGYGSGWGGFNGIASPSAPYGSSMTGAYALGSSSRLF